MTRVTPADRYDDSGNLTPAAQAENTRERRAEIVATFKPGDVVFDELRPEKLGVVLEAEGYSLTVVWETGGTSGGPGLVNSIWHREPRVCVPITKGMRAVRGCNQQQAVTAALRRAGIR